MNAILRLQQTGLVAAVAFGCAGAHAIGVAPFLHKEARHQSSEIRLVSSCDDDGSQGTLRYEIANAIDGATIDLSTLVCSTITLDSEISISQNTLTLLGPDAGPTYLAISGANQSSVFRHLGSGTFQISNLTIKYGSLSAPSDISGGCILSTGNVHLYNAVVRNCYLASSSGDAIGGGIFTFGDLNLVLSTVSGNRSNQIAGGIAVKGNLLSWYSSIQDNAAESAPGGGFTFYGGGYVDRSADIFASTISGNRAAVTGGFMFKGGGYVNSVTIANSTISGNRADIGVAGIRALNTISLSNSTIAFNRADEDAFGLSDGLYNDGGWIELSSSIIAGNSGAGLQNDLGGPVGTTILGNNNLITSFFPTLPIPGDTRTVCPRLQTLAHNGGPTRTHMPMHDSAAIDHGIAGNLSHDQRGMLRLSGSDVDIGSIERQGPDIDDRIFVHGFEGLCDQ